MEKGRYQIILDMIDSDTFKKLNEYCIWYLEKLMNIFKVKIKWVQKKWKIDKKCSYIIME